MSASNAGSPSDAPPVSEDVGARISRLEMHMQQSSEAMRHQAALMEQSLEAMRHQAELMESILRRLATLPLALAGGDEQLAALQELAVVVCVYYKYKYCKWWTLGAPGRATGI
jgi:methyl-accepting chemotaxis protein